MRTTEQWWAEVSADDEKMVTWLKAQYHGEATAEKRIRSLVERYDLKGMQKVVINCIADDEKRHAGWVKELLEARGITAEILDKEERYWEATIKDDMTFSYVCAVGHLAETMRLERITLLAEDDKFQDIAEVFSKILPDEQFHAKAFKSMTNKENIEKAKGPHKEGMNALGLVA